MNLLGGARAGEEGLPRPWGSARIWSGSIRGDHRRFERGGRVNNNCRGGPGWRWHRRLFGVS